MSNRNIGKSINNQEVIENPEFLKLMDACSGKILSILNDLINWGDETTPATDFRDQLSTLFLQKRENAYIFYDILSKLDKENKLDHRAFEELMSQVKNLNSPQNKNKSFPTILCIPSGEDNTQPKIINLSEIQKERQAVLNLLSIVNKYLDHLEEKYPKDRKDPNTTHGKKHKQSSELRNILVDTKLSSAEKIQQYQTKIQEYKETQLVEHTSENMFKRIGSAKGKTMVTDSEKVLKKFKP